MKIKGNYKIEAFGINEVREFGSKVNDNKNPNLLTLVYGEYRKFVFHKERAYDLVKAILGLDYLYKMDITREYFNNSVKKHGFLYVMNNFLKGRGFILVSTHDKNLGEKNKDIIIGITNISDNGKLLIKNDKNLFVDNVHYDEMFRYNQNNNQNNNDKDDDGIER